ncbi:MAG TPA: glycosyltransferase [Gemmatales bacterium]|nr:glycosyltransferase [Gemmatales bacterium]
MTSLFPNPYQPHLWSPNRLQLSWLARKVAVDVLAPLPWTREKRGRKSQGNLLKTSRVVQVDNLTVDYVPYFFPPGLLRGSHGQFYRWSVRRAFARHLHTFQPDIVFTHWAYPDGWAAVKLGHAHKIPVVIQVLGSDVLLLHETPSRRPGTVEALQQADGIWAVSKDLANRVADLGVPVDKIRLIYDGVDTTLFHPGCKQTARQKLSLPPEDKIILFAGNLVKVKAIDKLLEACEILHERGVQVHLAIVGDGELRSSLETQASQMACKDSIRFHGALRQETLPDWFRAADVFVLPSYSEGVPNVLLEACACNTPYVASDVGGIREIAEYGQGKLVPSGDVSALADAIQEQFAVTRSSSKPVRSRETCIAEFIEFLKHVIDCYSRGRA